MRELAGSSSKTTMTTGAVAVMSVTALACASDSSESLSSGELMRKSARKASGAGPRTVRNVRTPFRFA